VGAKGAALELSTRTVLSVAFAAPSDDVFSSVTNKAPARASPSKAPAGCALNPHPRPQTQFPFCPYKNKQLYAFFAELFSI
jgi:hypothetical protein